MARRRTCWRACAGAARRVPSPSSTSPPAPSSCAASPSRRRRSKSSRCCAHASCWRTTTSCRRRWCNGRRGTLLSVRDRTVTPAGGRLLREWLRRPLRDPAAVRDRLDAVEELLEAPPRRERLRAALGALGDPERLAGRAVLGTLTPREAG